MIVFMSDIVLNDVENAVEYPKTPDKLQNEIYKDFLFLFRSSLQVAKKAIDGDLIKEELKALILENRGKPPQGAAKIAREVAKMKVGIAMRVLDKAPPLNKNASESPINLNFNIPRPENEK